MPGNPASVATILDAWREQGADRRDPLAFHYLEALQRRLADHGGEARHVLEAKLATRINAYVEDIERVDLNVVDIDSAAAPSALAELTHVLNRRAVVRSTQAGAADTAPHPRPPQMGLLDDVRKLWSNVHTSSHVRRSLEHTPENVGPLNSSSLVHRSLTLMREVSPGYLQQFMSYVDALSWLEQLSDHGVLAPKSATQPASGRPRAPRKPRKRTKSV